MFDRASTSDSLRRASGAPRVFLRPRGLPLPAVILLLLAPIHGVAGSGLALQQKTPPRPSPANANTNPAPPPASGVTHNKVGQPVPDYMTGDACLFCHRNVVGPTWQQEPHAWTIRTIDIPPNVGKLPPDATHVIGSAQHYRALKSMGYGKFAVLAADGKTWLPDVFATQCAGCHTTAVDPKSHTFATFAFDCFACHGDLQDAHTTKPEIALLGSKRPKDPKEIVEICASCHLRGGRSMSSGLPYPNGYIAGDDLFADFKVDLKRDLDPTINPADRHAYTYTRKVMEGGSTQTCLECHRVHGSPELKHEYCIDCDDLPGGKTAGKLRSETCQY